MLQWQTGFMARASGRENMMWLSQVDYLLDLLLGNSSIIPAKKKVMKW